MPVRVSKTIRNAVIAGGIAASALWAGDAAAQQQRQAPPPPQQQQQAAPPRVQVVQLDQATLDKWFIVFADIAPQTASQQEIPPERVAALYDSACRKAKFADVNLCQAVDDYMGALMAGASEDGESYVDPVQRARQDLAALNADPKIPAKDKAEQRAEIQAFIASLPERIPPAHVELLNRNAKRISDLVSRFQPPPEQGKGPPPGAAPQPQGQRR